MQHICCGVEEQGVKTTIVGSAQKLDVVAIVDLAVCFALNKNVLLLAFVKKLKIAGIQVSQ